jgi:DNA-binding CsgD family transcriptional regulator
MKPAVHGHRHGVPDGCPLSTAEHGVIQGLADGKTPEQIAGETSRSISTIRTTIGTAYRRLKVGSSVQAVIYCFKAGWVTADAIQPIEMPAAPAPRIPIRVTTEQALYLEAFERWLRTGDADDRDEATVLLRIVERKKDERKAAH